MTVVGIIHDAKQWSWAARADEEMYIPFLQDADYLHNKAGFLSMTLVARTRGPVSALAPMVRERIRAIDRNIPVAAMTSMEQVVSDAVWQPRMATSVLSGFAVLALVLATTGIFAVMSYIVAGRTQEIGIRMALGARQTDVLRMVLLQSLRPVALGVALGLCGAAGAHPFDDHLAVRGESDGPRGAGRSHASAGGGGGGRGPAARAPRRAHRSADCAAP